MSEVICIGCKQLKPEPPKVVIKFYNGKPVYNQHCNECQRAAWMKFKESINND